MDPAASAHLMLQAECLGYFLEYILYTWKGASSRRGREAVLKEARQEVARKPWLWSLLPEWLRVFSRSPECQSSCSDPFLGSGLAFGGPRSLQKTPKRRKARVPAPEPAYKARLSSQRRS
ncbi:hypothetical protein CesoFtcFv8_013288 [Champsocephalus esox]|uniref:Uncharacterized protein n=1 Tax=Champsocephalus esox TaxID=159716 RepID=A0AAN8BWP3_9TELE|nr:hypothetical protein CesoFtcFv8_013288 [Champsocephalus esox]